MTLTELKENISKWNVPDSLYSINDGIKPNAFVVYENYTKWEFFYVDERGGRNYYNVFYSENEAYEHLWKILYKELQYKPSTPPPSVYGNKNLNNEL